MPLIYMGNLLRAKLISYKSYKVNFSTVSRIIYQSIKGFNCVEFDTVRSQAGLNSFVLTPQKWVEQTNAIGIISKSGRYDLAANPLSLQNTIIAITLTNTVAAKFDGEVAMYLALIIFFHFLIKLRHIFFVLSHPKNSIFLINLFYSLIMRYLSFSLKNFSSVISQKLVCLF